MFKDERPASHIQMVQQQRESEKYYQMLNLRGGTEVLTENLNFIQV